MTLRALEVYSYPIRKPTVISVVNKNVITIIEKSVESLYWHLSIVCLLKKHVSVNYI